MNPTREHELPPLLGATKGWYKQGMPSCFHLLSVSQKCALESLRRKIGQSHKQIWYQTPKENASLSATFGQTAP